MKHDNFRPMTADEYKAAIEAVGLQLQDMAPLLNEGRRTITRHANGEARIPGATTILLRLLNKRRITLKQIMQARL